MSDVWFEPSWQAAAHAWIEQQLDALGIRRDGEIEQPHVYVWSTVMRVPTDRGDVWFKANMATLRHEAAVSMLLSSHAPDLVPPLLAVDLANGWMLMTDAGEQLRKVIPQEASLDRWLDVLEKYAALQIEAVDDVDELLAVGVPDMRLATLPEKYERLVGTLDVEPRFRDAVPYVRELCDALATYAIPETIQHDDLHDGQVFVRDDRQLVLDWGDACVSHPFFTLSVTLEGVISWALDDVENSVDLAPFRAAYLGPFRDRYRHERDGGDLDAAVDVALRLGWASRAVNGHIPGEDDSTRRRLSMFLDGTP